MPEKKKRQVTKRSTSAERKSKKFDHIIQLLQEAAYKRDKLPKCDEIDKWFERAEKIIGRSLNYHAESVDLHVRVFDQQLINKNDCMDPDSWSSAIQCKYEDGSPCRAEVIKVLGAREEKKDCQIPTSAQ